MDTIEKKEIIDLLYEIKYRVEITKRARIKASARLRLKHIWIESIIYFYSILILILSIWFLGMDNLEGNDEVTKYLLILSLTMTFLSMYLNMRNYKERAGNFETNYQNLDILLNKIERKLLEVEKIDVETIKQIQREYEKLLIDKENHKDIDYKNALEDYKNSQERKR